MKSNLRFIVFALSFWTSMLGHAAGQETPKPKLILQITVDQLRADLPRRYLEKMGQNGFRLLYSKGICYENAHHDHSNTETIVGHTTLATGAHPAAHGLIGNVWLDRSTSELRYNVEDPRYPLLTEGADVDKSTEIDPTQRLARTEGRSPSSLLVSTFSDELTLHTVRRAKVFGVSIKDRGAVALAGHSGKAFWFSKAAGKFVSSKFYYEKYPDWVSRFNKTNPAQKYANKKWELLRKRSDYHFADLDDMPWEVSIGSFGRTFPHSFGDSKEKLFTTFLTISPAGDELTLDFAKELIDNESIGADDITDYLSVSFSSTDYVGHMFGPSSLEAEDNLLRLDQTLAELFKFVDDRIGLQNTLVVLSADHGGPEVPAQLRQIGIEANYVKTDSWDKQKGIQRLKKKFGVGEELIDKFFQPYVYLNQKVIKEKGLDLAEVERAVAAEMMNFEGVAYAVSSHDLLKGQVPDTPMARKIINNHHPKRSGNIFVLFEPHWFINDFDGLRVAATHGSPWSYDTYVPVIFAFAGLKPKKIYRRIHTVDVATTLSAYVGAKPPSGASGNVLKEVVE